MNKSNTIEQTIRDLQLYIDVKWGGRNNMLNLALTALREKAEREKGCKYCDDNFKFWQTQISGELPNVRFCPMCGKRLKVEYEHKWQREVDGEWKHYYPECQESEKK